MAFLDPDLLADETSNAEAALAALADYIPGWTPSEHSLATYQAEAWGASLATAIQVFRDDLINAYLGLADVLGVARTAASSAEALSTWTLAEPLPAVIPGGTEVTGTAADGSIVEFAVREDVPVTGAVMANVPLVSVEVGAFTNGVEGEAFTNELLASTIIFQAPSAGGSDEEELPSFLTKLRDRASRMRLLPITPEDFAAFATDVAGVDRAFALNRYNPSTPTVDSPGDVTVFPLDSAGLPLGAGTRAALEAYFNATERVLGTNVYIADPAFQTVTVVVIVQAVEDADPGQVAADVEQAIIDRLGRAVFDRDEDEPGRHATEPTRALTRYHIAAAVDDLPLVRTVVEVTLNGGGLVTLPAPLTVPVITADSITVTVTPS